MKDKSQFVNSRMQTVFWLEPMYPSLHLQVYPVPTPPSTVIIFTHVPFFLSHECVSILHSSWPESNKHHLESIHFSRS